LKKREARAHRVFEIHDIQRRRTLIEIVAIASRIEAEERA